jgi:hypothetical protein
VLGCGSRKLAVALLDVHTPSKIRARFHEHRHTSLVPLIYELWDIRPTLDRNDLRYCCRNARETVVL